MTLLDLAAATTVAARLLAERQTEATGPLVLGDPVEFQDGWLFPYQSAWALDGDEEAELSGFGPIFVRRTGTWFEVPAYYDVGEFLGRLGVR